jgi:hypothetical protein
MIIYVFFSVMKYGICWSFIQSNLIHGRYPCTRPYEYDQIYQGLADKFIAHSQLDKAKILLLLKDRLLESWNTKDKVIHRIIHRRMRLIMRLDITLSFIEIII